MAAVMRKADPSALAADEDYVAACRALPKGSAIGIGITSIGGIVSASVGSSMIGDSVEAAAGATGSDAASQMAFGLTHRRIVVWKCSAVSGKPTAVIGEIALDTIGSASFEKTMFAGFLKTDFVSGKTAEFTMVKADKPHPFRRGAPSQNLTKR